MAIWCGYAPQFWSGGSSRILGFLRMGFLADRSGALICLGQCGWLMVNIFVDGLLAACRCLGFDSDNGCGEWLIH